MANPINPVTRGTCYYQLLAPSSKALVTTSVALVTTNNSNNVAHGLFLGSGSIFAWDSILRKLTASTRTAPNTDHPPEPTPDPTCETAIASLVRLLSPLRLPAPFGVP